MKNVQKVKNSLRKRRKIKIRKRVLGTDQKPRLSVYRSLKHIHVQLIDDSKGETLVSASDLELKGDKKGNEGTKKVGLAREVGKLMAQKAIKKNIKQIVFDRGQYKYHGRIKSLAEGVREGGIKF